MSDPLRIINAEPRGLEGQATIPDVYTIRLHLTRRPTVYEIDRLQRIEGYFAPMTPYQSHFEVQSNMQDVVAAAPQLQKLLAQGEAEGKLLEQHTADEIKGIYRAAQRIDWDITAP